MSGKIFLAIWLTVWILGSALTLPMSDSGEDALGGCVVSLILGLVAALVLLLLYLLWGWALA